MLSLWAPLVALLLAIPLGADQTRHPTPLPESPHLQPNGVTTYVPPSPWTAADPDPPASLVAHWTLDEESGTRADSLGVYDLTDNNTVGFDTGVLGNAASFVAASSESLSVSPPPVSGLTSFTAVVWVYDNPAVAPSQHYHTGIVKDSTHFFNLFSDTGVGGRIYSQYYQGGVASSVAITGQSGLAWRLVVGGYDASSHKAFISINGAAKTYDPSSTSTDTDMSSGTFYFGRSSSGFFTGLLDEGSIFDVVLSDDQITYLYGSGTPPAYPFAEFP